jgi:hypothetical protein
VVVGVEHHAVHKLDHRLRLADRLDLTGKVGRLNGFAESLPASPAMGLLWLGQGSRNLTNVGLNSLISIASICRRLHNAGSMSYIGHRRFHDRTL